MENAELLIGLLGLYMMYTWGHLTYIQFKKNYKDRSGYERFVTWFAIITLALFIIWSLS